jgi:uncharacterized protein YuzE
MKITYDTKTDILRIRLNDRKIDESNELLAGVIVDVDTKGQAVGFEILDASKRMANPMAVELDIVGVSKTAKRPRKKMAV